MADSRCPLCRQPLPESLTQSQLETRIQQLTGPALTAERKRLEEDYKTRLVAEHEIARQQAERDLRREIVEATKKAEKAEEEKKQKIKEIEKEHQKQLQAVRQSAKRDAGKELKRELDAAISRAVAAEEKAAKIAARTEKDIRQRLEKEVAQTVRRTTRETEVKFERMQVEREKEKLRHRAETAHLQGQLDNLSRKLEKQNAEQFGEEGEYDLFSDLRQAFPEDRIERIGRGVRGADVLQHVIEGGNTLGLIVYESKNVATWQNAFISQAEAYRTRYETPYVMVVSGVFPRKEKDLCNVDGIPVVRPGMAASLAAIMRQGIVDIGRLRLSGAGRDQKAQQLLEYITSDRFSTRFRVVADAVDQLREQQKKERNWHENAWEAQSEVHNHIDKSHREIDAQMKTILNAKRPVAISARA